MSFRRSKYTFLTKIGVKPSNQGCFVDGVWKGRSEKVFTSVNPVDNEAIAEVCLGVPEDYDEGIEACIQAAKIWMKTPAYVRCRIVKEIGEEMRNNLTALSRLVSIEVGMVLTEAIAEVQEVIDMCEYAANFSEKLYTNGSIVRERRNHVTMQVWNPLGVVGIITHFSSPCADLGRNASMALACGNCVVWKGARTTPLVTIAVTNSVVNVLQKNGLTGAIFTSFCGGDEIGQAMAADRRISLVSFSGTSKKGLMIQHKVNQRFGRCLLNSSGNHAITIMGDVDIEPVADSVVLEAIGGCGQSLTACHRLFIEENIYQTVLDGLIRRYKRLAMGNPLNKCNQLGPLHSLDLRKEFRQVVRCIKAQGGRILAGGSAERSWGNFVLPTIAEISPNSVILKEELFAPILYVFKFGTFQEAIEINNTISREPSNFIFTRDPKVLAQLIQCPGSGYGNVHMISGEEMSGGSSGGKKSTRCRLGARSDSWEQYMRLTTCTINYGYESPFA